MDHLDRHETIERNLTSLVYDPHTAPAERRKNLVPGMLERQYKVSPAHRDVRWLTSRYSRFTSARWLQLLHLLWTAVALPPMRSGNRQVANPCDRHRRLAFERVDMPLAHRTQSEMVGYQINLRLATRSPREFAQTQFARTRIDRHRIVSTQRPHFNEPKAIMISNHEAARRWSFPGRGL
jgi:hypothetical protein